MASGFSNIARVLRHRDYRIYLTGNFLSLVGWWMQRVGVGWLTWQLTESATWLGAIACAELVPTLFLGPIAGAVSDRIDRLIIVRTVQILSMAEAALLAGLTYAGLVSIEILFGLTLFVGIIGSFSQPARLSFISSLVPSEDLSTAIGLNSSSFNLARFMGPACAGLAILHGGVATAFLGNAVSYLAFLISLWMLHVQRDSPSGSSAEAYWAMSSMAFVTRPIIRESAPLCCY